MTDNARREYNRRQKAARRASAKPVDNDPIADRIADKVADRIADIVRVVVRDELQQNPWSEAADNGTVEPKRSEGFGSTTVSQGLSASASASAPVSASADGLHFPSDDERERVHALFAQRPRADLQ